MQTRYPKGGDWKLHKGELIGIEHAIFNTTNVRDVLEANRVTTAGFPKT